jgi:release factor glutamine methyltransferase
MNHDVIILSRQIGEQCAPVYEHIEEQQQVAWWFLQAITGRSKAHLIADKEIALSDQQEHTLARWVEEHAQQLKPLQYILGSVPFAQLDILVEPPVLIPRPETEEWCIHLIEQLKKLPTQKIHILDLCTGSGCIALALAKALPESFIIGTDISEKALALAQKNAFHNKIKNVEFLFSDVYDRIAEKNKFDLIVANPPYITPQEWQTVSPMVKEWEDQHALVAEQEGLAIIRKIIEGARQFLVFNHEFAMLKIPQLVIEIGYKQGKAVASIMEKAGFQDIAILHDLSGKDRLATGRLSA